MGNLSHSYLMIEITFKNKKNLALSLKKSTCNKIKQSYKMLKLKFNLLLFMLMSMCCLSKADDQISDLEPSIQA